MTRQWLAFPELMCTHHYLGEHAETHMFMKKMEAGWKLEGFRKGSMFFGAEYLKLRHDKIAKMLPNHKTPLVLTDDIIEKYPLIDPTREDINKSLMDLLGRCVECKSRHEVLMDL